MNGVEFLTCLWAARKYAGYRWLGEFLRWLAIFNIAELWSYLPLRAFSMGGDVAHLNAGLNISPWVTFMLAVPLVAAGLFAIYRRLLPGLWHSRGTPRFYRAADLFWTTLVIFGMYGAAPVFYYGFDDPRARWSLFSLIAGFAVLCLSLRQLWTSPSVSTQTLNA